MIGAEYQNFAMRTNDKKSTNRLNNLISNTNPDITDIGGVLNGCLGLAGEAGETLDMVKKWIFHEKDLDIEHLKKELGDVAWYLAMLCESFDFNLDEILEMNVAKLKARYPEGFDTIRANNRAEGDV